MLKFKDHLLLESIWDDAARKFQEQGGDPDKVKNALDSFKKLSSKGLVKGPDKDIGKWIKSGWGNFDKMLASLADVKTKGEQETASVDAGVEVIYKDPKIWVGKIKNQEAACKYGANTRWCISAKRSNAFHEHADTALIYMIINNRVQPTNRYHKLAITVDGYDNDGDIEIYDALDNLKGFDDEDDANEWLETHGIPKDVIEKIFTERKTYTLSDFGTVVDAGNGYIDLTITNDYNLQNLEQLKKQPKINILDPGKFYVIGYSDSFFKVFKRINRITWLDGHEQEIVELFDRRHKVKVDKLKVKSGKLSHIIPFMSQIGELTVAWHTRVDINKKVYEQFKDKLKFAKDLLPSEKENVKWLKGLRDKP